MPKRYRLRTLLAGKVWPWRDSLAEAVEDAIGADMAWHDEYGVLTWDPFVRVEEVEVGND